MLQVVVGRPLVGYIFQVALLISAATAGARVWATEAAVSADEPAINDVRIGFADHLKVAHWTQVQVRVNSLLALADAKVKVTAPDNDGIPTVAGAPLLPPAMPDADRVGIVYTNVGRLGAPVHIALTDGDQTVESRTLLASVANSGFVELPATSELLVFLGPMAPPLLDAHTRRNAASGELSRKAVRVESVSELPDRWFGYDAVDVAILTVGDGGPFDRFCMQLTTDEERFAAFVRWVELGGRLVIFCGGQNADEMLSEGQPLAKLLPGRFADVVRLPETGRLEHFASSEISITAREPIPVPRLVDVAGKIELYEGRQTSALPLVVRSARGLGEITFVGIDPARPPFVDWAGRKAFLDAVMRPYLESDHSAGGSQKLVTRGYNDMSGALRQRLGRTFAGVRPIAFSMVTMIAIGYLLVLGPLDYFLIQRWFKQAWVAWITFPVIVLLFGGLALALAERRHGSGGRRVNQIELVDVDAVSGQARGTVWSAVFSPAADRVDMRLDVELPSKESGGAETRLSSWALPGAGIGGTQSRGKNLVTDAGYRYGDHLGELIGVPILTSGTKSLLGRWTAPVGPLVLAELVDEDGLATGSIENRTGHRLRNTRLYFGEWAYRLGAIADGARVDVGEELRPRSFKTIVTQDSLVAAGRGESEDQVFVADRASLKELVNVMMFYEAVGGFSFAQLQNRFQAYCDLSRLPMLGRAVLVAEVETTGSQLVDPKSGEAIGEQDSAAVIYRFVLPVRE